MEVSITVGEDINNDGMFINVLRNAWPHQQCALPSHLTQIATYPDLRPLRYLMRGFTVLWLLSTDSHDSSTRTADQLYSFRDARSLAPRRISLTFVRVTYVYFRHVLSLEWFLIRLWSDYVVSLQRHVPTTSFSLTVGSGGIVFSLALMYFSAMTPYICVLSDTWFSGWLNLRFSNIEGIWSIIFVPCLYWNTMDVDIYTFMLWCIWLPLNLCFFFLSGKELKHLPKRQLCTNTCFLEMASSFFRNFNHLRIGSCQAFIQL